VATIVGRLAPSPLQRQELVSQIDKGHLLALTAKLEVEYPRVERQRFLDVAHFKRNMIETDGTRFLGYRHGTLPYRGWPAQATRPALTQ
jgi:hypothetical protein